MQEEKEEKYGEGESKERQKYTGSKQQDKKDDGSWGHRYTHAKGHTHKNRTWLLQVRSNSSKASGKEKLTQYNFTKWHNFDRAGSPSSTDVSRKNSSKLNCHLISISKIFLPADSSFSEKIPSRHLLSLRSWLPNPDNKIAHVKTKWANKPPGLEDMCLSEAAEEEF